MGNLNGNQYIREVLEPDVIPFLQCIHEVLFQQDIARSHIASNPSIAMHLALDVRPVADTVEHWGSDKRNWECSSSSTDSKSV